MQFRNIIVAAGYTSLNVGCTFIAHIDHVYGSLFGSKPDLISEIYGMPEIRVTAVRTLFIVFANMLAVEIANSRVENIPRLRIATFLYVFVIFQLYSELHGGVIIPLLDGLLILTLAVAFRGVQCLLAARHFLISNWRRSVGTAVINCYSGLYLFETSVASFTDVVPPLFFVFSLVATTFVVDDRMSRRIGSRIVSLIFVVSVFAMAYLEYRGRVIEVSYAPLERPWRSLYFSIVLGVYLFIPLSWNATSSACVNSIKRQELISPTILISTICMIVMPILFCFTPHGTVLALLSSTWIAMAHVVSSIIFRGLHLKAMGATSLIIAAITTLYVILALDRIYYHSLLSVLAPTFPIGEILFAVLIGSGLIATVLGRPKQLADVFRTWYSRADFVAKCNGMIAGASLVLILLYMMMHKMFDYGNKFSSGNEDLSIVQVPLDGLSGLSSWSWAALSYFVNLVIILFSEILFKYGQRCDRSN